MSWLNNQRLRNAIFGAVGGLIGAILAEILEPERDIYQQRSPFMLMLYTARWGMWCGLGIGTGLGLSASSLNIEAIKHNLRNAGFGALLGLVGGFIGSFIAQGFYSAIGGGAFLPRAIGWAIFGVLLGAAQGVSRQSIRGGMNAALGGAIGGGIGGICFDVIGLLGGVLARLFGLTVMGFFIGLLIAVFQAALASGVLKILSGRLEGHEFYLDKPRSTLGLSDACDIGLFGDKTIAMQHAIIQASPTGHTLVLNPNTTAQVNGITHQGNVIQLTPEDRLIIGNTKIVYRSRNLSRRVDTTLKPITPTSINANYSYTPNAPISKVCTKCGSLLATTAKFCGKCGNKTA